MLTHYLRRLRYSFRHDCPQERAALLSGGKITPKTRLDSLFFSLPAALISDPSLPSSCKTRGGAYDAALALRNQCFDAVRPIGHMDDWQSVLNEMQCGAV